MNPQKAVFHLILVAGVCTTAAADDELVGGMSSACLDTIWRTVNEVHYDSTFGGVDWNAIYTRYDAQMADIEDDDELIRSMNEMLQELGLSHYAVFRTEDKAASGSPLLSEGSLGLDVRLLDDRANVLQRAASEQHQ